MKRYFHATLALIVLISLSVSPICQALENTVSEQPAISVEVMSVKSADEEAAQSSSVEEAPAPTLQMLSVAVPAAQEVVTPPLTPVSYHGVVVTTVQTTGGTGRTDEELIELFNNSDTDIDVTGWKVTSGATKLYEFVPESKDSGHFVILPAGKAVVLVTPAFSLAHTGFVSDGTFANGKIANANGSIQIVNASSALVSGLSWGSGALSDGAPFSGAFSSGGVLVRKLMGDNMWYQDTRVNNDDFKIGSLRPSYDIGFLRDVYDACLNIDGVSPLIPDGWQRAVDGTCAEIPAVTPKNPCDGLQLTEVAANTSRQFIELYNSTDVEKDLTGCKLMTNRSKEQYTFTEQQLAPYDFAVIYIDSTQLTLTKTTIGTVYFLSEDAVEIDSVSYANLHVDTSWSRIDDQWLQTYLPTPGEPNEVMIYPACDEGYERNQLTGRCSKITEPVTLTPCKDGQYRSEETGRCRMIETASTLKPCAEGQYRSEETNRCRSIVATVASALKPCADDQFRNPATGRCKLIASVDDLPKPCAEGQERNQETNRCRKISVESIPAAAFPVEPVKDSAKAFAGWWALGGILILGASYATWEWRDEIRRFALKAATVVRRK